MQPRVRVPAKAKGGSMNPFGSEGPSDSGFVDIGHEGEWPEAEPSEAESVSTTKQSTASG